MNKKDIKSKEYRYVNLFGELNNTKTIYKFYSLGNGTKNDKRKIDTLEKEKIWVSDYIHQNDLFEFASFDINSIQNYSQFQNKAFFNEFSQELDKCKKATWFASFTNSMDKNISMWSYYTNNFKGFCCEFEKYEFCNSKNCMISDVLYNDNIKPINPILITNYETLYNLQNNYMYANDAKFELLKEIVKDISFNKGKSWEGESEQRALYLKKNFNKVVKKPHKGRAIAFKDFNIKLKGIYYVGAKCDPKNIKKLHELGKKLKVNVYEMKKDETSYKLVINKKFKY